MEEERKKGNRLTAMAIDGHRTYKQERDTDMNESYGAIFKPGYKNKFKFISEKYLTESFDNEFDKENGENYFDTFSKENTDYRIIQKIQE